MSAVTVLQPPVRPSRRGATTPVRHLRLVSADEPPAHGGPLRLTVRARRLMAAAIVALAVAALAWGASTLAGGAAVPTTVTVSTGQTLSDVAARHLPDLPRGTAVSQIQRANGLSTMHVSAGATLTIPRG